MVKGKNGQARLLAVAQQKGGAGKTTLAVHLSVAMSKSGYKVALIDVDPQGSASAWYDIRKQSGISDGLLVAAVQGWKLSTEISRLQTVYDIIIIDTPPHAETDAKVAVRSADLLLVPLQPSPMDVWATRPTLELARNEKTSAVFVLNRVPARGKMLDMVRARIAEENIPLAVSSLGNRSAYTSSLMGGRGVVETNPRSLAAKEIFALATEIGEMMGLPIGK